MPNLVYNNTGSKVMQQSPDAMPLILSLVKQLFIFSCNTFMLFIFFLLTVPPHYIAHSNISK